jgi:hypothetical protein
LSEARRMFAEGYTVREVLAWLKEHDYGSIEAIKALKDATPLSLSEAKVCGDDFCNGDSRYQDDLTADRLTLLRLATKGEYLHNFFRHAVLFGHRRVTIVSTKGGFDFWHDDPEKKGSWFGESLPNLDGLFASFQMSLGGELAEHVQMSYDGKQIQLRIRLEGET